MSKLVHIKFLIVVAVASALLWFVEWAIHTDTLNALALRNVHCAFAKWEVNDVGDVTMKVNCDDGPGEVAKASVVVSYLTDDSHSPLTCKRFASGNIKCDDLENKDKMKKKSSEKSELFFHWIVVI